MKTFPKFVLLSICAMLLFLCLPSLVHAQVIDPGCDPSDPRCPIDSGLGFLIAAGIGYGIKKIRFDNK